MLYEYKLSAPRKHFYNITPQVREAVTQSKTTSGIAVVYCPHTTAVIESNDDDGVAKWLDKSVLQKGRLNDES